MSKNQSKKLATYAAIKDYRNKAQNIMIPSGITNKELEDLVAKKSSPVITYYLTKK